mmetsp:Transcript_10772/g.19533  ORF Transcript_10772/g.19533 Transcript_10772/m.19533 type:complete len:108 (-) Transcript_10772:154-477(-)
MVSLSDIPSALDIPLQVQVRRPSSLDARNASVTPTADGDSVRAILKYHNDEGRRAIIASSLSVHHDFGPLNQSLAVSLSLSNLESIKSNPNVEWFEGDGRVIYCSIR